MKPVCVAALFIALAGPLAEGETFIGATTSTNRLLVPTNSAIIITATFGPGTLYLNSGVFYPYAKFISYFIAEDGFTLPDQRAIAGSSGSLAISVEKSVDLNSWSSVLMQNSSDPVMAYYRLRIQR